MYWVIQSNIYEEENFASLIDNLERLGLPHSLHRAVPFVGTLDPEPVIPAGMPVVVLGSYSLARHARNRGWLPGAFLENLDFRVQREHWGNFLLNADAVVLPFDEIPFQREPFFIRPVLDTKTYTGLVLDWGEYERWRDTLRRLPEAPDPVNDPLSVSVHTIDEPTMLCSKKEIYTETRTWIVDGRVVTCSGYKVGTRKVYSSPADVSPGIIAFAENRAQEWSPNRAYVMDIAQTAGGLRIVEINNLNSAGWYRCDMQRLLMAIDSMEGY